MTGSRTVACVEGNFTRRVVRFPFGAARKRRARESAPLCTRSGESREFPSWGKQQPRWRVATVDEQERYSEPASLSRREGQRRESQAFATTSPTSSLSIGGRVVWRWLNHLLGMTRSVLGLKDDHGSALAAVIPLHPVARDEARR